MKDSDFSKRLKRLFALKKKNPLAAAREFLALADKYDEESKKTISWWHVQQSLALAAIAFQDAGKPKEYLEVEHRASELHRGALLYHGHAIANSLGRLAVAHFSAGNPDEGVKCAYEALRYFGDYPESSYLIEQIGRELEKHRKAQQGGTNDGAAPRRV